MSRPFLPSVNAKWKVEAQCRSATKGKRRNVLWKKIYLPYHQLSHTNVVRWPNTGLLCFVLFLVINAPKLKYANRSCRYHSHLGEAHGFLKRCCCGAWWIVESLLTLSSSELVLCKRNRVFNPNVVWSSLLICIYLGTQVISGDLWNIFEDHYCGHSKGWHSYSL